MGGLGWTGLLVVPILVLASLVQTAVGFGAGLVAIPLLVWLGLPLPGAIAAMYGLVAVHTTYNLWRHRRAGHGPLPLRDALRMSLSRWAFLPLGVWLLDTRIADSADAAKRAVGAALIGSLLLRRLLRPVPRPRVSWGWTLVAGSTSGVLAGLVGMGGPPLVIHALAHDWPQERFRSYLWLLFLFGLPVGLGMLAQAFGVAIAWHALLGALALPCAWLGSELGVRVSRDWPAATPHRAATALLWVLGASSLLAPWL
jgi:uncharacterized membrane protein YfcA